MAQKQPVMASYQHCCRANIFRRWFKRSSLSFFMSELWATHQTLTSLSNGLVCLCPTDHRDQGNVTDFEAFKSILRYNDWQNDPYSQGHPGAAHRVRVSVWRVFGRADPSWPTTQAIRSPLVSIWRSRILRPTEATTPRYTDATHFPQWRVRVRVVSCRAIVSCAAHFLCMARPHPTRE